MRYTKYHPRHGAITVQTGGNLFDLVGSLFSKLPSGVGDALKSLPGHIAKAGAKTAGEKIGTRLADRLTDKILPEKSKTQTPASTLDRKEILKELKLYPEKKVQPSDQVVEQYGFGRRKKIRGRGLKILT